MAKFYLIRHGKPDYSYVEEHGFIGHGNDLAPLQKEYICEVKKTAKDERLKDAEIILSSPYTRAMQTASIISKETGLDIIVEPDLMEWQPDLTYQYSGKDVLKEYYIDFLNNNGIYPEGEKRNWETLEGVRKRVMKVINKYKKRYDTIIVVAHAIVFRAICDCGKIEPAEIFEINFK